MKRRFCLLLAALAYARANDSEGDVAQTALELLLHSGIADQEAAEQVLEDLRAGLDSGAS